MDILKRLPGECGTPVCMPATWKMLKKGFWGKLSIVLVQKNIFYSLGALTYYWLSRIKWLRFYRATRSIYTSCKVLCSGQCHFGSNSKALDLSSVQETYQIEFYFLTLSRLARRSTTKKDPTKNKDCVFHKIQRVWHGNWGMSNQLLLHHVRLLM